MYVFRLSGIFTIFYFYHISNKTREKQFFVKYKPLDIWVKIILETFIQAKVIMFKNSHTTVIWRTLWRTHRQTSKFLEVWVSCVQHQQFATILYCFSKWHWTPCWVYLILGFRLLKIVYFEVVNEERCFPAGL